MRAQWLTKGGGRKRKGDEPPRSLAGFKKAKPLLCSVVPAEETPSNRWALLLGHAMTQALDKVESRLESGADAEFAQASSLGPKAAAEAAANAAVLAADEVRAAIKAAADGAYAALTSDAAKAEFAAALDRRQRGGRRRRLAKAAEPTTRLGKLEAARDKLRAVLDGLEAEKAQWSEIEGSLQTPSGAGVSAQVPAWVEDLGSTVAPAFLTPEDLAYLQQNCPLAMAALEQAAEGGAAAASGVVTVKGPADVMEASMDVAMGAMASRVRAAEAFRNQSEAYLTKLGKLVHEVSFQGIDLEAHPLAVPAPAATEVDE
ncbi:uncharacterized protein AMSG_02989 [Thecamonas trahens ATCC 50062]|uniref:Uncharacterized protein n=1 Tax=Thecamonas trahens ATCC 50062 TaxID=461836 RepID=A0A0L0D2K5_THETB|nr:hypothetical protein AMSG_02989 [Thecamonas trahens ATCC 50062]KNC46554.1 hypothetical protein AMSG_02989 [Thecamonas trahens ATCC 50062]|eukprot:XP_013760333.1 hypothetical protein AMSG_02989 [Thecamonas trahens ATCC 50062]